MSLEQRPWDKSKDRYCEVRIFLKTMILTVMIETCSIVGNMHCSVPLPRHAFERGSGYLTSQCLTPVF